MKTIVFYGFSEERQKEIQEKLNEEYKTIFIDAKEILFDNIFNKEEKYTTLFIPDDLENLKEIVQEFKTHLKISVNLITFNSDTVTGLEVDNFLNHDFSSEEFDILLRGAAKITELLDTGINISNDFYHFEFFKRIIHIEIKRAKRYGISLSLLYLTFNNIEEITSNSKENFDKLFKEFNAALTTSIRDIDIPIAFGKEAILLLMPHTNKGGANIVAERIFNKLTKNNPEINFSISVVSPEKEELNFSTMMRKIHEGIEESVQKGGNLIIVK